MESLQKQGKSKRKEGRKNWKEKKSFHAKTDEGGQDPPFDSSYLVEVLTSNTVILDALRIHIHFFYQIFGIPKDHRKAKPYHDYVIVFSIVNDHICFWNYHVGFASCF
ncbi:hypothetical protein HHK36_005367 [Tetracentron sinense]|uniref:Uncharacterized protein n=1 Tax=Tetracentron sinense TaxID=13715 RepID=A0A835DM88_TETSI|nr:hypothetical protein HHK36_005367 [Tetracentron sinense]